MILPWLQAKILMIVLRKDDDHEILLFWINRSLLKSLSRRFGSDSNSDIHFMPLKFSSDGEISCWKRHDPFQTQQNVSLCWLHRNSLWIYQNVRHRQSSPLRYSFDLQWSFLHWGRETCFWWNQISVFHKVFQNFKTPDWKCLSSSPISLLSFTTKMDDSCFITLRREQEKIHIIMYFSEINQIFLCASPALPHCKSEVLINTEPTFVWWKASG